MYASYSQSTTILHVKVHIEYVRTISANHRTLLHRSVDMFLIYKSLKGDYKSNYLYYLIYNPSSSDSSLEMVSSDL